MKTIKWLWGKITGDPWVVNPWNPHPKPTAINYMVPWIKPEDCDHRTLGGWESWNFETGTATKNCHKCGSKNIKVRDIKVRIL